MIRQKITEIAEILGWSVDFSEPQNGKTDVITNVTLEKIAKALNKKVVDVFFID